MIYVRQLGFSGGAISVTDQSGVETHHSIFPTTTIAQISSLDDQCYLIWSHDRDVVLFDGKSRAITARATIPVSKLLNEPKGDVLTFVYPGGVITTNRSLQVHKRFNLAKQRSDDTWSLTGLKDMAEQPNYNALPVHHGDLCKFDLQASLARQREDGLIIVPYTIHDESRKIHRKFKFRTVFSYVSGIAKFDLSKETVTFDNFKEHRQNAYPVNSPFVTLSPDSRFTFILHHQPVAHVPPPEKSSVLKSVFGKRPQPRPAELRLPIVKWNIEHAAKLEASLETGTYEPYDIVVRSGSDWDIRDQWFDENPEYEKVRSIITSAVPPIIPGAINSLRWDPDELKNRILEAAKKHRIDASDYKIRKLWEDQNPSLSKPLSNRDVLVSTIAAVSHHDPSYFERADLNELDDEQFDNFSSLLGAFNRAINRIRAHLWLPDRTLLLAFDNYYFRRLDLEHQQVGHFALQDMPMIGRDMTWNPQLELFGNDLVELTYSHAKIRFECPGFADEKVVLGPSSYTVVYEHKRANAENEIADKLTKLNRKGVVKIKDLSAAEIIAGISRLTQEYTKHHEDMVVGARWDAPLYIKNKTYTEHQYCSELIQQKAEQAVPVLTAFVQQIIDLSAKSGLDVWHEDDETITGTPAVNAIIRLTRTVPQIALDFSRIRDVDHDIYTVGSLADELLLELTLQTPGLINLITLVGLQRLGTGNIGYDLFSSPGFDQIAEALKAGQIGHDTFAHLMLTETQLLQGNCSWTRPHGDAGLIARAIYGLDRSEPWQDELAKSLLKACPDAQEVLDQAPQK